MPDDNHNTDDDTKRSITVTATTISGIVDALEVETVEEPTATPSPPAELEPVIDALSDVYRGVELATDDDSRGRSRKIVMEYAGRDDLSSEEVGYHLRSLESHGLIVQDGNRWRIGESLVGE